MAERSMEPPRERFTASLRPNVPHTNRTLSVCDGPEWAKVLPVQKPPQVHAYREKPEIVLAGDRRETGACELRTRISVLEA